MLLRCKPCGLTESTEQLDQTFFTRTDPLEITSQTVGNHCQLCCNCFPGKHLKETFYNLNSVFQILNRFRGWGRGWVAWCLPSMLGALGSILSATNTNKNRLIRPTPASSFYEPVSAGLELLISLPQSERLGCKSAHHAQSA